MIKERPLLYSGAMVRAILAGDKSQTRRIAKPPLKAKFLPGDRWRMDEDEPGTAYFDDGSGRLRIECPHGKPGDRLWVRETFARVGYSEPEKCHYRADGEHQFMGQMVAAGKATDYWTDGHMKDLVWTQNSEWRPSIHMPRWACRLVLEITAVRVERVQDITPEDALAEGVEEFYHERDGRAFALANPYVAFARLWDAINLKRGFGWASNPWVWVVGFKRLEVGPC